MVCNGVEPTFVATNTNPKMVRGFVVETKFHVFDFADINIYVY